MAKIINSQEFDNTIESGVVVVDFFATWCGPCKMLSPVIDELSGELENVNFVKVDIDQSMDLAQKFKIVSVPTLKVFKNGKITLESSGVKTRDELAKLLAEN